MSVRQQLWRELGAKMGMPKKGTPEYVEKAKAYKKALLQLAASGRLPPEDEDIPPPPRLRRQSARSPSRKRVYNDSESDNGFGEAEKGVFTVKLTKGKPRKVNLFNPSDSESSDSEEEKPKPKPKKKSSTSKKSSTRKPEKSSDKEKKSVTKKSEKSSDKEKKSVTKKKSATSKSSKSATQKKIAPRKK
jgi:hypothetical protein